MRILIGVPCPDFIRAKTVATLISLVKADPTLSVTIKQGCYIHKNREEIAEEALKGGYSHLFFVDADMCFSAQVLKRLLSHNKDIVGGVYKYRRSVPEDVVRFADENGNPIIKETPKELFKCFALGTGCLLIKTSVFQKLKKPWFFLGTEENQIGEDIYFCKKANEAGIEVWGDPSVGVGHIGEFIFG